MAEVADAGEEHRQPGGVRGGDALLVADRAARLGDRRDAVAGGGFLLQEADVAPDDPADWRVVSRRAPDRRELVDLAYAWGAVRHVKSNAIVLARDRAVVGVGSGQPNRVESVRIATKRAGDTAAGAALASDAFFPFPDGIEEAAAAGVTAIVQPGGSVRDQHCFDAADRAGVAMLFTGVRHFRH